MPKTKIRPGEVVKRILQARPGQSTSELYQAYKGEVQDARNRFASVGEFGQRIMSSESFRKYIWFARQLGLVEEVGRGDPVETGNGKTLYMLSTGPGGVVTAEPSTPLLLALTPAGAADQVSWNSLGQAYRDRGVVSVAPVLPPPEPRVRPAPRPAPTPPVQRDRPPVPTIDFPDTFSTRSSQRLLAHLEQLVDLAEEFDFPEEDWPDLADATKSFEEAAARWRDNAIESKENAEERGAGESALERLEERETFLSDMADALEEQDLRAALEQLEQIE